MRLSLLSLLFGAATVAVATESLNTATEEDPNKENTYFNQIKVPPILELTPDNYAKAIKASKWLLVKNFSPWCHHCQNYAPIFQTTYEYYYTSKPAVSGKEDTDFTKFYDFRFATLDCEAYGDLCSQVGVQSYPTTHLYKDGEIKETIKGVKTVPQLSKVIETALEESKPGTRPKTLDLPEPGEKESPSFKAANPLNKNKKDAGVSETVPAGAAKTGAAAVKATTKKASKPSTTANPDGKTVALTAEKFQSKVTMTQDLWFIKFYAPWCHHCQAMAPNWDQMAKEMKGQLNVGAVNCEAESRLCKDIGVRSYPTIMLFKGAERVEYEGLRGLGDFVSYAEKAVDISNGVQDVDEESFKELEKQEEVIFVYFYDHATTSEDFMALERLPMSLIGRAKLVKTKDPKLYDRYKITTWPRLLVSREDVRHTILLLRRERCVRRTRFSTG